MRWLRGTLAVVAVAALLVALQRAVQDAEAVALPGAGRLAVAAGLLAVSLVMAASVWAILLPGLNLRQVFPGFALAQLAKYVPGSVWQGVGQVADAHRLGVGAGTASLAFMVQLAVQVIAAAGASAVALVMPGLPIWLRVPAALAPFALVLVNRRWLAALIGLLARRSSRLRGARLDLPTQAALVRATWRSGVTILAIGASFAVLLPTDSIPGMVGTAGVFMLAWLVGFLVVPLPAGVGVREAVLVAGLAATHPVADVLAAAIVARLLLLVVEGIIAAAAQALRVPSLERADRRPGSGPAAEREVTSDAGCGTDGRAIPPFDEESR